MLRFRQSVLYKKTISGMGRLVNAIVPPGPGIIFLIYHSIADKGSIVSVPPNEFQEQIRWLIDNYRIVSLDEALSLKEVDEDVVVLSFDDGYKDYLTEAYPILQRYNAPSIVYVVTNLVQNPGNDYQIRAGFGKKPLSLKNIEDLKNEELVTIGSHTHTHKRLTKLSDELLIEELETSYEILKGVLETETIHFSYPWAVYNERTTRMVRKFYQTAVIGKGQKNQLPLDSYRLQRIPVVNEPLNLFKARVQGNFLIEGKLREILLNS